MSQSTLEKLDFVMPCPAKRVKAGTAPIVSNILIVNGACSRPSQITKTYYSH